MITILLSVECEILYISLAWARPCQPKLNLDNAAVIGAAVLGGNIAAQKYGNKILKLVCRETQTNINPVTPENTCKCIINNVTNKDNA